MRVYVPLHTTKICIFLDSAGSITYHIDFLNPFNHLIKGFKSIQKVWPHGKLHLGIMDYRTISLYMHTYMCSPLVADQLLLVHQLLLPQRKLLLRRADHAVPAGVGAAPVHSTLPGRGCLSGSSSIILFLKTHYS